MEEAALMHAAGAMREVVAMRPPVTLHDQWRATRRAIAFLATGSESRLNLPAFGKKRAAIPNQESPS